MTINEAGILLSREVRSRYNNIHVVGIRSNNVEAYDANPHLFAERITEDSLIVYTTKKPTKEQKTLEEFKGFKVRWMKNGKFRMAKK